MSNENNIFIDKTAFEDAYEMHWKELYLYCNKYLQDLDLSKGFVQDIFISLWEKRKTIVIHTSVKQYLYGALKLKVLEHYRKQTVREKYTTYTIRTTGSEENNITEEDVLYRELQNAFASVIHSLPVRSRQVYQLSRERGMDNKTIASELLITEKAVESNMTRALAAIKNKLRFFNPIYR